MKKREFLKKAGVGTAAAVAAVNAPFVHAAKKTTIKWRLQTYAGAALAEHVIKPSLDDFNKVANGEMVIELFTADQLVPTVRGWPGQSARRPGRPWAPGA